jgi:hypothetical protein
MSHLNNFIVFANVSQVLGRPEARSEQSSSALRCYRRVPAYVEPVETWLCES